MATLIDILQYISQGQIASHTQELFFGFFLPFIITLIIFFSVLQMVGAFRRKINLIVSLIITILASTTPVFSTIATWIGRYSAYTALAAFFIVFVIGIGAWTFRRSREYVGGLTSEDSELKRLYKRRSKLLEEIDRTGSDSRRAVLYDELEHIDKRIRYLELQTRHHHRW